MTIERSHGKARPTLPRSSDLRIVETDGEPSEGRAVGGRFAPGNRLASGQRWKASIRKLLGRGATNEQATTLAREAFRLYLALLREVPSDGPTVRMLAALQARHAVLAAHFTDRAGELGFESAAGADALELATKHGQRAERLAVTTLDVSTKMRSAKPARGRSILDEIEIEAGGVEAPARHEGGGSSEDPPTDTVPDQTRSGSQPGAETEPHP